MPRKLRVEYPGAIHHVMNRGNRRQDIVRHDHDRHLFAGCYNDIARAASVSLLYRFTVSPPHSLVDLRTSHFALRTFPQVCLCVSLHCYAVKISSRSNL